MHTNHTSLPGYDERQLLHDGCPECEKRGSEPETAILHLDALNFRRAWARAAAWHTSRASSYGEIAACEVPMLRSLWAVQVMFERLYGQPLGELPAALLL